MIGVNGAGTAALNKLILTRELDIKMIMCYNTVTGWDRWESNPRKAAPLDLSQPGRGGDSVKVAYMVVTHAVRVQIPFVTPLGE